MTGRVRKLAQVAAAEAKPLRDAAPLGCWGACAGRPPPESCMQRPTSRLPSLDLNFALFSFACRRVRAPLAYPGSEAGEGVGGGC